MKTKKYDEYLLYLYSFSQLSKQTICAYLSWSAKLCLWVGVAHPLDVPPGKIDEFRLYLLNEKKFSWKSDTVVFNALKHTYSTLLKHVEPEEAKKYANIFRTSPRQPNTLPRYVTQESMAAFCAALPATIAGNLLRSSYQTGKTVDMILAKAEKPWKVSQRYLQQVCLKTALKVGMPKGFGVTGVRGAGILHRIQNRQTDLELTAIREDSGLSHAQFLLYCRAAGVTGLSGNATRQRHRKKKQA
jgi:hypothetical protein